MWLAGAGLKSYGKMKIVMVVIWLLIIGFAGCVPEVAPPLSMDVIPSPGSETPAIGDKTPTAPAEATQRFETLVPTPNEVKPEVIIKALITTPTVPLSQEEIVTMPISPTIPTPSDPAVQRWIEQAKVDLSGRLSLKTDQIELLEFKMVTWPDGSLGCPQPGMAYTQVQRDGFLIRLSDGGRAYNYHGGGGQPPFLCEGSTKGRIGDLVLPPGTGLGDD
jgi:hypothetical protein